MPLAPSAVGRLTRGIIVSVTPLEPEWEGFVGLAVSNAPPLPAKICADNKGKYLRQRGITIPNLECATIVPHSGAITAPTLL